MPARSASIRQGEIFVDEPVPVLVVAPSRTPPACRRRADAGPRNRGRDRLPGRRRRPPGRRRPAGQGGSSRGTAGSRGAGRTGSRAWPQTLRRRENRRSHRDELSLFAVRATVADLADPGAFPVDDAGSAEVASGDGPHGSETGFDGPGRSRHLRRLARPASFAGGRTPCSRTTRIAVTLHGSQRPLLRRPARRFDLARPGSVGGLAPSQGRGNR